MEENIIRMNYHKRGRKKDNKATRIDEWGI